MIIPVLEKPEFKGNASDIAASNKEVWKTCSSIVKNSSQSPKSSHNYLKQCLNKFTKVCGPLAYYSIVYNNVTLKYECCFNILNDVGKECYDDVLVPVLEQPEFKANASEIRARSDEIWRECSSTFSLISYFLYVIYK